ncbi:MAG: hydroxyacid dehydrogenase [Deltaproteobacteria bacterium]|nr:hydroxyacid dehydrogenase [Deltaproteobacteria bacterium]
MVVNTKRVFYIKYLMDPIYASILARRPDITLEDLNNCTKEAMQPILAAAQVYQISSARGEIILEFYADKPLLARTPNLLVVSTNGVGYDTVNLKACTEAGVLVVNPAGGNRESVAEHVMAMMLCLSKRIIQVDRFMRRESDFDRESFMGNEILGKTIGIVGIGHVGSRVAELCRGLFTMRVLACDPYLTKAEILARGAEKVDLDDLLCRSDYVSINCPLTDETLGMIGARQYALMRLNAYFINTARGFIHDEAALAEALGQKKIAGAGLDVWSKEPPPHDHPLLQCDNVLVSPHTAGVTREARANIAKVAAEQVLDILDGKRPPHILNIEVWPIYKQRFKRIFGFTPQDSEAT